MEKKKIIILGIVLGSIVFILTLASVRKTEYRAHDVEAFEKIYLPQKMNQCIKENGYTTEALTVKQKKKCEDYVNQIWDEQKVLNNIEE